MLWLLVTKDAEIDPRTELAMSVKSSVVPGQLHPLSLIRMVWKHKLLIGIVTTVITLAAAVVIARLPAIYRAEAVVLVDSQKIPEKFVASTVQVGLQDSLNAISQQVLSSGQLQGIIDTMGLYQEDRARKTSEEILDRMRNTDLSVTLERGLSGSRSGAFRIAYEGRNPQVVAEVVDRITDLFIRANSQNREQRAVGTSQFIDSQLKQAKQILDQQEASLSSYKTRFNGELPQQEGALLGALNRLQAEFQANEDAINRAQQNRILLQNSLQLAEVSLTSTARALAAPPPRAAARAETPTVAPVVGPRNSDLVRTKFKAAQARYTDDHPEIKRLSAELSRTLSEEAQADAAEKARPPATNAARVAAMTAPEIPEVDYRGALPSQADLIRDRERVTTTKTQIELLDREMASRNAERKRIQNDIAGYQNRVDSLPLREQQMSGLTRDYETWKANYRSLLDKKMSAEMAKDMERGNESERFTIADPAHVPSSPVKPHRWVYLAASALLALALSLVLALGIEFRKDVVLGEWELAAGYPVLGRIGSIRLAAADGNARTVTLAAVTVIAITFGAKAAYLFLTGSA
jgi:succinoglycan biosynthesis transport protein ExoP